MTNLLKKFLFLLLIFFQSCAYEDKKEALKEGLDLSKTPWLLALDDNPDYSKPEYPVKGWSEVEIPSNIREIDPSHRGSFWLRKNFEINPSAINTNLSLNLGKVYEKDEVYLNGKLIGINGKRPDDIEQSEYAYNRIRNYPIPANVLVSGNNTIAIRITSNFHNYAGIIAGENGISTLSGASEFVFYEALIDAVFLSAFLFIGIFFFINYVKMPEMKEYLSFSLFIIIFSGYDFCRNEFRFLISNKFLIFKFFEYVFLYNIPFAYILFFQRFFHAKEIPRQRLYFIFNLLFPILFLIIRDPSLWSIITSIWIYHVPIILIYTGYLTYEKIKEKNYDAYLYGIALLYFFYGVVKEVLLEKGLLHGDSSIDSALLFYVFMITLLLRFRFLKLKLDLQKRFDQLTEIDRLREKLFEYMNLIILTPIESTLQLIRAIKADSKIYSSEQMQIIEKHNKEIDHSLDDILELSRLEVKPDSPLKDTVNFVDFIKSIIPDGEITYTIKVDPNFQINNTLDLVNSLMIRIIDFTGFKNFTSKDLILTSDLKDHLHFRFMFYNKEHRNTIQLFRQLNDKRIKDLQTVQWAIIKEILRLLEGKLEMGLINKKYLRVDLELKALPLELPESTVELETPSKPFNINIKDSFETLKFKLQNIKLPKWKK
ncbi:MAG: 7TM diverse intracellular signaling domain-containing protein [Leptospiraceae bacterium]|nr:7TM diverse intracellular signaling domain-containing protein [Leptospiraceae bacterium]